MSPSPRCAFKGAVESTCRSPSIEASVNWIRAAVSVFANASTCAVAPLAQVLALVINAVRGVTGLSPISRLTLQ